MPQPPRGYVGAYSSNQRGTETGRDVDAHALLSCASRLEAARAPDCSRQEYVDAIKHNMRLWTVFQVCVTDEECDLPHDVKISLFRLSRYVDKVSFASIAKRNPDALIGLININRQIAAGLSTRPQVQPPLVSPSSQQQPVPSMQEPVQITT